LISAIRDPDPVVFVDDRWLYSKNGEVPEEEYTVPIGKGIVRRPGKDVSLVSFSYSMDLALKATEALVKDGVDVELIDLRSLKPYDKELLISTVKKTGRLVIVDNSWKTGGFSAELSSYISEFAFKYLKAPIIRVNLPDIPAPASSVLEAEYYISAKKIIKSVKQILGTF
jgi:pyruvate dehydrogenase E1 component beta subunit